MSMESLHLLPDNEAWWPVNPDNLTSREKRLILRPIRGTLLQLTHKFRWKNIDAWDIPPDTTDFGYEDENELNPQVEQDITLLDNEAEETTIEAISLKKSEKWLPSDFALWSNYPNPFNPSTTITFDIAKPSVVKLTIYNSLGQTVRALYEGTKSEGRYDIYWDGKNDQGVQVPSGMYIYRLEAGEFTQSKKMMLVK